jgi:hypothetical protein
VAGVRVFGQMGEGQRDAVKEKKKNLISLPLRVNGRRRYTVSFQKQHRFELLFLCMNSE